MICNKLLRKFSNRLNKIKKKEICNLTTIYRYCGILYVSKLGTDNAKEILGSCRAYEKDNEKNINRSNTFTG